MKARYCILLLLLWFFQAIHVQAQYYELSRARYYIENKEYLEAAKLLRPLAEQGNAQAAYMAAGLFLTGKGVIKSDAQAEKYYLVAVDGGHKEAVFDLLNIYDSNKQYGKAWLLMAKTKEQEDKYEFTTEEKKVSNYIVGKYIYHGYGMEVANKYGFKEDKIRGWRYMYKSGLMGDSLESLSKGFYKYLIEERTEEAAYYLCEYLWEEDEKHKRWSANHFDDYIAKVKSLPADSQASLFMDMLERMAYAENKTGYAIPFAIMLAEGIGTNQDITAARAKYAIIDDATFKIIQNALYYQKTEGHMEPSDFPEFWKMAEKDYAERKVRWDFVAKRRNVKLSCGAPCFKLKRCIAYPTNEGTTICFEVYNTSPNSTGRTTYADGANVVYKGRRIKAKVEFYKDSNVGLKGHSTTNFYVKVSDYLPKAGEFESVSFFLKSDFGRVLVMAKEVVWNEALNQYH